jgi:hypothetical protein
MLVLAKVKKFVAMRRRSGDIACVRGGEAVSSAIDPPAGISSLILVTFPVGMQHLAEQAAYRQ